MVVSASATGMEATEGPALIAGDTVADSESEPDSTQRSLRTAFVARRPVAFAGGIRTFYLFW